MQLRYGLNPEQPARATIPPGGPITVVAGAPSYINLLDALNAWQLVADAAAALGAPAAASFKHVSPAGVATAGPLDEVMETTWGVYGGDLTALASAYVRARDCDPRSAFGDFVAVSEAVDEGLALVLAGVVSDGIIAPGFEPGTVDMLARKKRGQFLVIEANRAYRPPAWEERDVFGVRLAQATARPPITADVVRHAGPALPTPVIDDLVLAMITARYTQSNTVALVKDGMALGVGAGQQSRVDCTKLAGSKADTWWLRRHPAVRGLAFLDDARRQARINWQIRAIEGGLSAAETAALDSALSDGSAPVGPALDMDRDEWLARLSGVAMASDGLIPFRDNIDQAVRHGVRYVVHPGAGSVRADEVAAAASEHGITLISTGARLFHH